MKYTKILLSASMVLLCSLSLNAQNDDETPSTLNEDEITLPEGMQTQEIDSLLKEWNIKNYLQFDDSCETTGENPVYEPEEYVRRLDHLPNVIEMPYNDVIRKYIDMYSGRLRRSVSIILGASNFYNPIFEQALESYQIPLELKYLPVIESALNPGATSRAGAVGLWQFMITTGKQYGLEVTSLVDERRDPIKASYAAAHYLKDLYDIFGDWTLVIASYNCGPNNVNKAIKRAGGVKNYWAIYNYLPKETQGYVPAFVAANYIMNYYCDHDICPVNTTLPQGTDTLLLDRDVRMEQIVNNCNITLEELKALNPQYRTTLIPGSSRPCILRMPTESVNAFLEAGDSIYVNKKEEVAVTKIEVEAPKVQSTARKSSKSKSKARTSSSRTVTVRSGDSLGAIAKRNHTTVAKLKKLNGIKGTTIRSGQKIKVR